MSDETVASVRRRLHRAAWKAQVVWKGLPGPVAWPTYGWWCPEHDSVYRGENVQVVDGELACPERTQRRLDAFDG
jgi:hypothetical protein